jgi:hypothetical protein
MYRECILHMPRFVEPIPPLGYGQIPTANAHTHNK